MTSVAELHARAVAVMAERPAWRSTAEPPRPPAIDLTGAIFGGLNTMSLVVGYAGWLDNPGRPAKERHTWVLECLRCAYRVTRSERRTHERKTTCRICAEAGVDYPPSLAEALAAYALRQQAA